MKAKHRLTLFTLLGCLAIASLLAASPTQATNAVGRTPGHSAVSPTGAFTYSIPIKVPPGPKGVAPHMALTYSSRTRTGPEGVGWSLEGLSAIYRCNSTYAQDAAPGAVTLTYSDRFCIDGKRLRLTSSENLSTYGESGTTYQTEIADFSNITATGTAGSGPSYFTVQRRDGYSYVYGFTNSAGYGANSQVLASGSTTASAWLLSQIKDRFGNTLVAINYLAGTGAAVPQTISWAPTSAGASTYSYVMTLTYNTNTPQSTTYRYVAGTQAYNGNLLSSITLSYNSTVFKDYALTYSLSPTTNREKLTQVQECAQVAQTNCLAPTVIGYQNGTIGVVSTASTALSSSGVTTTLTQYDFNGDGRPDIAYYSTSTNTWYVSFSTGTGFSTPVNTGITSSTALVGNILGNGTDGFLANNGGTWWYYAWNGTSFAGVSTGVTVNGAQAVLADTNGDGLPDLVWYDDQFKIYIQLNTSSGSTPSFSSTSDLAFTMSSDWEVGATISSSWNGQYGALRSFDFDGDGRQDIVLAGQYLCTGGPPSVPGGATPGLTEFCPTEILLLARGTSFTAASEYFKGVYGGSFVKLGYGNFNSDNCTDITAGEYVYFSACNGASGYDQQLPSAIIGSMDWDGDGRTDILVANGSTIGVYLSTGGAFSTTLTTTSVPYYSSGRYFAFDADGDGLDDLGYIGGSSLVTYWLHASAAMPPDLVSSIVDGYGIEVIPSYASIIQNNYTEYTDGTYPDPNYVGPLYVTSQYTTTSPASAGGTYEKSFWYYGAHKNIQGRGFDGFESMKTTDSRTASLVNVSNFYATFPLFPYTGQLVEQQVFQNNGTTLISKSVNSPDSPVVTLDATAYNERYFPFISSTAGYQYEVGGTENGYLITTTNVSYAYDSYGNATSITKVITDNDSNSPYVNDTWTTTTTNTFDVDGSNGSADLAAWCLPLADSTSVAYSSSLSGSTAVTVAKNFTLDTPANCRVTQSITQPSSSTYKVTEAYGFDAFNNVNSDSTTGINMTARTWTANWGATGQFALTVTNPLSQITTTAYANPANYEFGVPSSVSDPNAIVTSWGYDAFGRKNLETRPDGTETTWTPSWCSSDCGWEDSEYQIAKTQLESNGTTVIRTDTTTLDPFRHVTETSGPTLSGAADTVQKSYDAYGRPISKSFPYLAGGSEYWQTISYDPVNRPVLMQRPISSANSTLQSTSFQYAGRTAVATDAMSNTKTTVNDVNGWLRKTTDGVGYAVTIAYDSAGDALQRTDSLGHTLSTFTYGYGIRPFKITASDADMGAWSFTPDALGEITNWEDAKSQTFSESYDALSRPLTRIEPDLFTQWTWGATPASHNIGKLQSVCTGTGTSCNSSGYSEAETYDSDGRLSTRAISIPGFDTFTYTWAYNSLTGFLNTLTYPESTSSYSLEVQYGYANGILSTVTDVSDTPNVTVWAANTQNAFGQITQDTLGNGVVTNRTYDGVTDWLGPVTAGVGGGSTILNQSNLYDESGDLTERQNNNLGLTENFYYDNDYRLTSSKLNGTQNLAVTYDASGNITSRSDLAGGASWTYDPARYHAVTEAGSSSYTFTYDGNGNATSRFGSSISWSSYNYPTSVTAVDVTGTENVKFSYGPDRSRWMQNYDSATETTYYIGGLMEQVDANITDYRHYVYAGSEPVAILSRKSTLVNTWSYLLNDHIGSISAITSSTGAVDINESFTSFGARRNPTTWSGAPASSDLTTIAGLSREGFTFQTALGQSMGLNHMNGRVQDAITGRFLSADPNIPDLTSAQSFNRYAYVTNNPLTYVDPSGFDTQNPDDSGTDNGGGAGLWAMACAGGGCVTTYQAPNSGSSQSTGSSQLGSNSSGDSSSDSGGGDSSSDSNGQDQSANQSSTDSTPAPSDPQPSAGPDPDVTPSPNSGEAETATTNTPEPLTPSASDADDDLQEIVVTGKVLTDPESSPIPVFMAGGPDSPLGPQDFKPGVQVPPRAPAPFGKVGPEDLEGKGWLRFIWTIFRIITGFGGDVVLPVILPPPGSLPELDQPYDCTQNICLASSGPDWPTQKTSSESDSLQMIRKSCGRQATATSPTAPRTDGPTRTNDSCPSNGMMANARKACLDAVIPYDQLCRLSQILASAEPRSSNIRSINKRRIEDAGETSGASD